MEKGVVVEFGVARGVVGARGWGVQRAGQLAEAVVHGCVISSLEKFLLNEIVPVEQVTFCLVNVISPEHLIFDTLI